MIQLYSINCCPIPVVPSQRMNKCMLPVGGFHMPWSSVSEEATSGTVNIHPATEAQVFKDTPDEPSCGQFDFV